MYTSVALSRVLIPFLLLGISDGSPLDPSLMGRGNVASTPTCPGEIIGYRTLSTKAEADQVNANHKFPKVEPHGNDIGKSSVYFSDGLGDYAGGGSEVHWCVAYANKQKLQGADKSWIPTNEVCPNIRFNDQLIDDYILTVSKEKFTPDTTLRFSPLEGYLQMAIPWKLLDTMEVCGICYPRDTAKAMKAQFPRVNFKAGDFVQHSSGIIKRADAKAVCPSSSTANSNTKGA